MRCLHPNFNHLQFLPPINHPPDIEFTHFKSTQFLAQVTINLFIQLSHHFIFHYHHPTFPFPYPNSPLVPPRPCLIIFFLGWIY